MGDQEAGEEERGGLWKVGDEGELHEANEGRIGRQARTMGAGSGERQQFRRMCEGEGSSRKAEEAKVKKMKPEKGG